MDNEMHPKVSIIILNWNGWKDTIECLESLYQIDYPNYDVILVDNGSCDGSVEKIREYAEGKRGVESRFFKYSPENKPIKIIEYTKKEAESRSGKEIKIEGLPSNRRLILIRNEKNYGFAEGNNIGIRYTSKALEPDYILLLNNDTVVNPRFLSELVNVAEREEKIGILGPKIYYYDEPNIIASAGAKIDLWKGYAPQRGIGTPENGSYKDVEDVDYVTGCALFIKTELIENIGMLDSSFFAYWEETDFCMRSRRAGYRVAFVPESKIWHKISATTNKVSGLELYYMTRNQLLFMKKHANALQISFFSLLFLTKYFPHRLGSLLFKHRSINLSKIYLQAVWHGLTAKTGQNSCMFKR